MDDRDEEIRPLNVSRKEKLITTKKERRGAELRKIEEIFYPPEPESVLVKGETAVLLCANVIVLAEKRASKTSLREIRFSILQQLAEKASQGLLCLFAIKELDVLQFLLLYKSREEAENSQLSLNEKSISTETGSIQLQSKAVTTTCTIECVAPLVADCSHFMQIRLKELNIAGCPTPKKILRSIYNQRKKLTYYYQKASSASLPANITVELPRLGDDHLMCDSAMSSGSAVPNQKLYHEPLNTKYPSDETRKNTLGDATDACKDSAFGSVSSLDCLPSQFAISNLNQEERTLQLRYWALLDVTHSTRCTSCAIEGHMSWNCPSQTCNKCHAYQEHSSEACPAFRICTKCRELGHRKEDCPSKLSMTSADGLECTLCKESGHTEETCAQLWRSYNPSEESKIIKVDELLINCYQCGLSGHWGDDCRVIPKRKTVSNTNDTFSAKSANMYLSSPMDPRGLPNSSTKPTLGIAQYDEDDDTDFYRSKVPKQATRGAIKIRTTRDLPGGAANYNNSNHTHKFAAKERPKASPRRQRIHHPPPTETFSDQLYSTNELPVNTYLRGGSVWQPPLPNEPLPSKLNFDTDLSRSSGHKLPNKPAPAQRQKGYLHARNYKKR